MLSHLLLMRHAKSSWTDGDIPDHARPLSKRGKREADAVARTLTAKGLAPDIIWSSDARRTLETSERLIRIIPGAQTIIKAPTFYHASAAQVIAECSGAEQPHGRLMLVGHNPGWSELLTHFTGRSLSMATACCAVLTRKDDGEREEWIAPQNWRLADLLIAKELLTDDGQDGDA